jgi:hypothetical protein
MNTSGNTHLPDEEIHMKKFVCGIAVFVRWYCAGFAETHPAGEQASSFG